MTKPLVLSGSLHRVLGQVCDALHAPGVVVGVSVDGAEPLVVASGVSDAASRRLLQAGDKLRVGSVTKTFTAVAALQLAEAGALRLSDTVSRWAPAIPHADAITVEQLLRHTSGLFNYTDSPSFMAAATANAPTWTPQGLIAYATPENQLFPPGHSWAYSNTNYILLGLIIEAVAGQPLAHALRGGIFEPLQMAGTYLDGAEPIPGGFVPGYAFSSERPVPFIELTHVMHVSAAWAAGGIVSTAPDLLAFAQALFGGRCVRPDTLARMMDFVSAANPIFPFMDGYGLGLAAMRIGGRRAHGHLGNIPGYSSLLAHLPESGACIVILMNQNFTLAENQKVNVEFAAEAILQVIAG
jgi:D-alanyl-D-alanine carboxypeptidase